MSVICKPLAPQARGVSLSNKGARRRKSGFRSTATKLNPLLGWVERTTMGSRADMLSKSGRVSRYKV